jgi:hypothetical protein
VHQGGAGQGRQGPGDYRQQLAPLARAADALLTVTEGSAFAFRSLTSTICLCQALFIALAYNQSSTSKKSTPQENMMIEVALFGAGRIGKIHAANLAAQPGVQFKYVVDVNQEAAAALAAAWRQQRDCRSGIGRPGHQGRRHRFQHGHARGPDPAFGRRRQGHFLRKTRRFDDRPGARRAAAVKEAKVLCMLGFQRRYDPTFNAVKTRIEAGEIGTPELLVVTSRDRARRP